MPRWSPSGDRLAFVSDRSGAYEVYTVRADGSDLQPLDPAQQNTFYPVWSPAGDRILYDIREQRRSRMMISPWPKGERPAEDVTVLPDADQRFVPVDWSPDGALLAGHLEHTRGAPGGIAIYRFKSRDYQRLTESGIYPHWLSDSRHIVYAEENGKKIFVVDTTTRQVRTFPLDLHGNLDSFSMTAAKDGHTLYFIESDQEADLWLLDLP